MSSSARILVGTGALVALVFTPLTASAQDQPPSGGGAGTVASGQMPDDLLGYAGFHATGRYTETMGEIRLYASECGGPDHYAGPVGHRGREYEVTGFSAMNVDGPAGEVGTDVYQYGSTDEAAAAFAGLRDVHDGCDVPNEFGKVPQFLPETGLEPHYTTDSFTSHNGDYLAHGGNDTYTIALSDDYILVGGYETPSGPDAPVVSQGTATAIADQAVRVVFDSVHGIA